MKKLILLLPLCFLLSNCSSDSGSSSNSNPDSRITLKLNGVTYHEDVSFPPPNYTLVHSLTWSHATGTDYSINGYVTNGNDTTLGIVKELRINLGTSITEGQVIPVSSTGFDFSLTTSDLINPMEYFFVSGTTTGQIKITHFDGVKLSAEFTLNSLKSNNYSDPISYANTVTGSVTLIEKAN
jgi:hypothetical protein